ncbi:hypothetical protein COU91_02955 [Candidatus Saccharibacteria bacterium CG10_big_fil_rev_8_21_14_0_10_47_8]|nr:MAG: hypothetical protein COU91_02955 [Candidatus Saccharibacteria bacterium CG10_big_fil_rev_8_21_14_0_10_47_8]
MSTLPKLAQSTADELDHNRLLALINSMSDGVLALDDKAKIILSNSVALSLLDSNAINGKQIGQVLTLVNNRAGEPIDLEDVIFNTETPIANRDWRINYADGSSLNLFISISPVHRGFGSDGQSGYVILIRDITREKSIEEERDEFISVASHELRTPIAVAEGSISNALMMAQKQGTSSTITETLNTAHQQIVLLGNMINDLSTLSRAERGRLGMVVENFNADELVLSLVHDNLPVAKTKGLEIIYKPVSPAGSLTTSRLYVREILQNFITNSLKYTEKGQITLRANSKEDGIEFIVSDTGIGIAKSEQAKLFTKFFRSSDWRVKNVNGTGLGLYVTSKLAKLINARLNMDSELNKGSTFSLYVPNIKQTQKQKQPISATQVA